MEPKGFFVILNFFTVTFICVSDFLFSYLQAMQRIIGEMVAKKYESAETAEQSLSLQPKSGDKLPISQTGSQPVTLFYFKILNTKHFYCFKSLFFKTNSLA